MNIQDQQISNRELQIANKKSATQIRKLGSSSMSQGPAPSTSATQLAASEFVEEVIQETIRQLTERENRQRVLLQQALGNIESEKCLRLRKSAVTAKGQAPPRPESQPQTTTVPVAAPRDPEPEPPESDPNPRCTPSALAIFPRSIMGLFDKIKRGGSSLKKSGVLSPPQSQAAPPPPPQILTPAPPGSDSESDSEPDSEEEREPELDPSCVRIANNLSVPGVQRPRASSLKGPLSLPIGWGPPQTRRVSFSEEVLVKGLGDDPSATFVATLASTSQASPSPSPSPTGGRGSVWSNGHVSRIEFEDDEDEAGSASADEEQLGGGDRHSTRL